MPQSGMFLFGDIEEKQEADGEQDSGDGKIQEGGKAFMDGEGFPGPGDAHGEEGGGSGPEQLINRRKGQFDLFSEEE